MKYEVTEKQQICSIFILTDLKKMTLIVKIYASITATNKF